MFLKKTIIIITCAVCLLVLPLASAEIHEAAHSGNLERVKTLLEGQPELLEARADNGGTPLHYAAYGMQIEVMDFLLKKGADINAKDNEGDTPLVWVVANGKKDSAVYLLEKGADINSTNQNGVTPLIISITRRQPAIMTLLLEQGADPTLRNISDFSPLRISVLFGNLDAVKQLLSHGADPSEKYEEGTTALHIACTEGQSQIAEWLIEKGADISIRDSSGYSPFYLASFYGQTKICQILLSRGVDVNASSPEGDAPLHGAAWGGFIETAELLIDEGAEVDKENKQGFTPLDYALKAGRDSTVKLLKDRGAVSGQKTDSNRINNRGIASITPPESNPVTMTVLYDNYVEVEGTRSAWGFSCLIKGTEKTILFDTGGEEEVLLHNIDKLNIDLSQVDMVVLSHIHWDHVGGLSAVLERHPGLPVYVPYSFPFEFVRRVESMNSPVIPVNKPVQICRNIYLTGEMGVGIKEMSLICNSGQGPILVTGCSHPGIAGIVERATDIMGTKLHFVFGGFHLGGKSEEEINTIIDHFQRLGVEKCGATHCTGDQAINMFKEAYADNYISIGTGKELVFKYELKK